MECLHPHCPMGGGVNSWEDVVNHPKLRIQNRFRAGIVNALSLVGALGTTHHLPASFNRTSAPFKRLLDACPCLFAQLDVKITPRAVVHLCEVTLGCAITSANVFDAFQIQHPSTSIVYRHPPVQPGAAGGDIMEQLCSEVLASHKVPHMETGLDGWPEWRGKSHLSLNSGKMIPLKLYGDILIPAAPHNIMISVKSEAARERFVVSGNRLESVGFGFFNDPSEFWTSNRMTLLKRWGFIAVYMPKNTLDTLEKKLCTDGQMNKAININGRPLYRPLEEFGDDMARVSGKLSMNL